MSFYKNLASYYDRIFPLNQIALSFISKYFHEGTVVLDMGAGSENMAIALAEKGLHVTASEPEETMVGSIRHKSDLKELSVNVHTKLMEQIGEFQESFDGIVCIGNTLPHLPSIEAVEDYLLQLKYKLEAKGITIEKVDESYTTQTCPVCGNRKKSKNRNYHCQCGYKEHRDIHGARNIPN